MRLLHNALEEFANRPLLAPLTTVEVTDNLTLRFLPAGKPHEQMFVLGGSGDHDSGGFVESELVRNLSICVSEKSRRIANLGTLSGGWFSPITSATAGSMRRRSTDYVARGRPGKTKTGSGSCS